MPATKPYEAPAPKVIEVYEAPNPPINYERLHAAAIEEINRLNEVVDEYQREAKVIGIVTSALGFIVVDDKGRIFERVNDPAPRGPGPQGKMWVRIPGPVG